MRTQQLAQLNKFIGAEAVRIVAVRCWGGGSFSSRPKICTARTLIGGANAIARTEPCGRVCFQGTRPGKIGLFLGFLALWATLVGQPWAAGQADIQLSLKLDPTEPNGIWLWAAADNLRIAALTAVECAESMTATRPTGKIQ